jgi:hypothetical protein
MTAVPRWIREVIWDEYNAYHIARRHQVTEDEVESVCYGDAFARRVRRGVYRVTGQTRAGRWLTVFLSPRGRGEYYVITARNATLTERREAQRHLR